MMKSDFELMHGHSGVVKGGGGRGGAIRVFIPDGLEFFTKSKILDEILFLENRK